MTQTIGARRQAVASVPAEFEASIKAGTRPPSWRSLRWKQAASPKNRHFLVHRLSRHAIRYRCDLRTSSTAVLDTPMSASSLSSSSRSCLYWCCRSNPRAIPASHASGIFQDHLRSGTEGEAASRVLVELQGVLPQDMFHLRNGAKQRLAAGAHRAVVNGPRLSVSHPPLVLKR